MWYKILLILWVVVALYNLSIGRYGRSIFDVVCGLVIVSWIVSEKKDK